MGDGLSILLNLFLVAFLVLLNGFFVASEFALVKVRSTRLTELAAAGNVRAKVAQHVTSRLDAYLSACQLGITLASLGLGWVGEPAVAHLMVEPVIGRLGAPDYFIEPLAFGIAFAIITFLHIVLGELAPKSIAIFKAEGTSLWLSGPLVFFYKMTYPAIWVLNGTANHLLRWAGIRPAAAEEAGHTEEEIRLLIKESQKSGHIDENEMTLVENIFDFSERLAREIMIPRTMMECLYTDLTFEENLDIVKKRRHTRYPLADEDKDHILGWIHVTDVYESALHHSWDQVELRTLLRPLPLIPESVEISQVLRVMQQNKAQMVVVVDEYGGTAGLITMEDIMEEIVGDIRDGLETEPMEVEVLKDRTSLDGRILIDKVNELFGISIEDDEVDTLGGWIHSELKEAPVVGSQVVHQGVRFEITEMQHLRINRVAVHAVPRIGEDSMAVGAERQ